MRYYLLTALPAVLLATAQGNFHSHLLIEPGKQFILGGDQPGAFRVQGRNSGPGPVEVRERLRSGQLLYRAVLAPGQRSSLSFGPGSTALLRNASARQAVLDLDISGGRPGRMTYELAAAAGK